MAVVEARARLGLSIRQSEKVARSNKASPSKKRRRHRAASKIVRIFSGSGDCPARPEHLAVREGCTKQLSEADQKAQSPPGYLQNRLDLFRCRRATRYHAPTGHSRRTRRAPSGARPT